MSDVLLINPPLVDEKKYGKLDCDEHWSPPLGIAYLTTVLDRVGCDVRVIDLYYKSKKEAERLIDRNMAPVVGISCFTSQRVSSFNVAQHIRDLDKDVLIVMGGPHVNALYEQVLMNSAADIAILGEAETTFVDLLQHHRAGKPIGDVRGIAYKENGVVRVSEPRELIRDLDALPFPAYDRFISDEYASRHWFRDLKHGNRLLRDMKWISIVASRGCPFDCKFCSTPSFWKRKYRKRSPANIVDEIVHLERKYGYEFIDFGDDIFTLDAQWVVDICNELKRRDSSVLWSCCTRADTITVALLNTMKEAGCSLLSFGIESFSANLLEEMNKRIHRDRILRACDMVQKADIPLEMLLIVGNKGETDETIGETIRCIQEIKPFGVDPSILTIFPGTKLYKEAVRDGFLSDDYWLTQGPTPYDTRVHSMETLVRWHKMIREVDPLDPAKRPLTFTETNACQSRLGLDVDAC